MQPDVFQPPLTRWGHTWRFVLALLISVIAWWARAVTVWDDPAGAPADATVMRWVAFADLTLGVGAFVLVAFRRRLPVTITVVLTVVAVFASAAAGPATLALVSLATRRRWIEILPVALLSYVGGIIAESFVAPPAEENTVSLFVTLGANAVLTAAVVAWGMYVGSRRELMISLRARADLAEEQQAARISEAQALERARIAREMHDVLAHRISVVSMYAGALAFREDLPREQVRDTAKTIQDNAHLALTELREVLGVLREGPGDATPEDPQHDLTDIDRLVADAHTAGTTVTYERGVDPELIPPAIGRALYRCAQEGLTNARKHARGAAVTIRTERSGGDGEPAGIQLSVSNLRPVGTALDATPPPSGLGLIGLSERVALLGGTQTVEQTDRHFVLRVWIPLPI